MRTVTLYGPGGLRLSTVDFATLPLNPQRLRTLLLSGKVEGGPPGVQEAFAQVADLLRGTDAPPRIRAALLHAAAGLPRIKAVGGLTDSLGRSGVGLELRNGAQLNELIFDPRTSALMEQRSVLDRSSGAPIVTATSYLSSRVVDRLPVNGPLPAPGASRELSGSSAG